MQITGIIFKIIKSIS